MSDFSLIETILWQESGYFLLDLHLQRLRKSAEYFSFSYIEKDIIEDLKGLARLFETHKKYRVRLLLDKNGKLILTHNTLNDLDKAPVKIAVSQEKTSKENIFLYHKTTNRHLYDVELEKYRKNGFYDVIFLNKESEVTEGAISNVIVRKNQNYYTPPIFSGLLAGVYREYLLKGKILPLEEKVLYLEDLNRAEQILVVNSVRKMIPAIIDPRFRGDDMQ